VLIIALHQLLLTAKITVLITLGCLSGRACLDSLLYTLELKS
jgi:hypothetical protein